MEQRIEIRLSDSQKNLLESVKGDLMDIGVVRAIAAIVSKDEKHFISPEPSELEELADNLYFLANQEDEDSELAERLNELADYLEQHL